MVFCVLSSEMTFFREWIFIGIFMELSDWKRM